MLYETLNGDPANKIHALYAWSPDGRLEAVSQNYTIGGTNSWYYYHYNAQGDVVAVTDDNGALYRQYVYDPYGNIISVKDGSGNPVDISSDSGFNNAYTYRGYRYDSESGLYFLQSRYYAAGIGRFLTKDSDLGAQKNPQTLNRYTYCGGDPVNRTDPTGTSWFSAIIKAVSGIIKVILGVPAAAELGDPAPLEIGAQELSEVGSDVTEAIPPTVQKLYDVATKVNSAGLSPAGRAFQKHSVRQVTSYIGEITGHAAKNSAQGAEYVMEILTNPNSIFTSKIHPVQGAVLTVRLANGLGAWWSSEGDKFIGLLEKFTN